MGKLSTLKRNIDSLIAAVAGFTVIVLYTWHGGIGISPDSVVYSTTAEHLATNGRLTDFTQQPVINFPAFYPLMLSAIMKLTSLNPLVFAPYLNALLFAFLIYIAGNIMEHFNRRSRWYKIAILSCIVMSPALLEDYSMLWSETIFILLLLLFMIAMHRYFQTHALRSLIIAAIIAAIACVTRYAGITVIATGGIVLLTNTKLQWRRKFIHILLFSLISFSLLVINLTRNYLVSGTLTGFREKSLTSFVQNLADVGKTFCDWLPFLHDHDKASPWIASAIIVALAFTCVRQFLTKRRIADFMAMSSVFSLLYVLFMITTASLSRFEELNSRFMSPVFLPLLWCGSYWLIQLCQESSHSVKKRWIAASILIFICFQFNQLTANDATWDEVKDDGIPGYTEDDWKFSDTVQFIEGDSLPFKKNYTIYSDAPDAVYFFTGRHAAYLPHRDFKNEVQQFMNDPHCYLVWFTEEEDPDLISLEFIIGRKKMKLLKQFSDGAIYGFEQ
ncbi:MAG TPA: hypothetical protein VGI82_08195 [Chitinophagaceae bacterium]|jgi:hypothetical protein